MPPSSRTVPRSDSWLSVIAGIGVLEVLEDAVAQLEQRFACGRDADAPADPQEHRLAEFVLEQQNLPADRRLRDVQFLPGSGERAGLGDGPDDLELAKVQSLQDTSSIDARHEMGSRKTDCPRFSSSGAGARDRFLQVVLVHFDADEVDAELRAGHRRSAEPEERVGHRPGAGRPCRRRHYSGSRGGNVAGCGRSLSRLWMVS